MEKISGIADATQPNAGRIYDYWLGGHHNFEVDRTVAEQLLQVAPFMRDVSRLIRWFLGEATRRLIDMGYDKFLDFASGLPTMDHIHQLAHADAKVIYSDIDPVTVEYAREILSGVANARYVECDAGKPEGILQSKIVENMFGNDRKVAIGFNGIAWFLSDEQVSHAMKELFNWAAEGSRVFLCDADAAAKDVTEELKPFADLYASIGHSIHTRSREHFMEMAHGWKIDKPGARSLDFWIGAGKEVTDKAIREWGGKGFYGVILYK